MQTVKTPLKICLVGPAYPLRGGIANFNEALYAALQNRGHEVEIFSFSLQYPSLLFPGKSQFSEPNPAKAAMNITSSINSVNPLSWLRTARLINRQKPDLVIIRFWLPFMGPALGSIARRIAGTGKKVIAIADNIKPHEKKVGDKVLTRYFLRGCDGFITLSESVATDLRELQPNAQVKVMPHPIYNIFGSPVPSEEARKKLGLDPQGRYVLFFGFIRKYKGLDLLLEAMREVDEEIKLIVAGEFYEDPASYLAFIRDNNLTGRVILKDHYIPESDIRLYFGAANLVAQTYRTATQSGVTQIAYHFGKPMLVTDVGGLGEIVKNEISGFVTPPQSQAIAQAINRFYREDLEAPFTAKVKEEKHRFDWSYFCEGLENLYSELQP